MQKGYTPPARKSQESRCAPEAEMTSGTVLTRDVTVRS
jgi:hypothetical protein